MNYQDVELARQRCQTKTQELARKRKKIILTACAVIYPIELIIFLVYVFASHPTNTHGSNSFFTLSFLLPILAVCFFELVFIIIAAFLITHKDAVQREESFLAYKRAYKAFFVHHQLAQIFTDLQYNHEAGLDKKLLSATNLIYTGDIYKSNDLVQAKYKNTRFLQADVEVIDKKEEYNSDGEVEVTYDTVFKGRYLIFEFPKKFDFKMIISPNVFGFHSNPKTGRKLRRIETESPDFNKRFLVLAEDGFEAFYILNPAFIDNLEKLGAKYGNKMALYFSDNKLFIGLDDGNDAFEPPSPANPIDERAEKTKVTNDMRLITELVDSLKLDR